MKANASPMSVADYCEGMEKDRIVVNHDYQREEGVWTPYARSYFIESVLLGYPIPKIFLYTKFDLKTKRSIKEIVDGQQRSHALLLFYRNKTRLSKNIPTTQLREKRYRDLSEDEQEAFLSYSLSIDEFSGVPEDDIRESFARMNANNVSLNAEELLNAKYQGEFKWFILELSRLYREDLLKAGVLSRRDIVRMADTRIFSDLISILEDGFITTKPSNIEALYKRYDREFALSAQYGNLIAEAFDAWRLFDDGTYERLARKHVFYTYLAALIAKRNSNFVLPGLSGEQTEELSGIRQLGLTLASLNQALAEEVPEAALSDFVSACSEKTNVGNQKFRRFAFILAALENEA
ncbi:DUF262 domain-containing protein [Bradyrhizobium sp. Arg314]